MDKPGWKSLKIGGLTEAGSSAKFKTGDWRSKFPIHIKEKCTNCMLCVVYCPDDCILVQEGKIDYFDYDYCKGCGICFRVCPVNAIKVEDETKFEEFKMNPKKFEVDDTLNNANSNSESIENKKNEEKTETIEVNTTKKTTKKRTRK